MKRRIQLTILRLLAILLVVILVVPYVAALILALVVWILYGVYCFFTGVPIDWFDHGEMPDAIAFHTYVAAAGIWVYDLFKFKIFKYETNG